MVHSADDDRRQAEEAVQRYRDWAAQERAKGNHDKAARLDRHADNLHRHYGSGQREPVEYEASTGTASQGSSQGVGCSFMLVGLVALPDVTWHMWELLAR